VLSPCPTLQFLGTFAKLRKATINFSFLSLRPSVRPYVLMEQLSSH
jgi:hypothetical protein